MATTDTAVTMERVELIGSLLRRNSTGNFGTESTTSSKVLPHYLQAPSPSCHDYCKYGHRNTSETKARKHFPSLIPDKSTGNRKTVLTYMPSQDVKSYIQLKKIEALKKAPPKSSKKADATLKQVFEPKVIDLKSRLSQTKPPNVSSSKSLSRRHSDTIIPIKGLGVKEMCPLGSLSSRRNIDMRISNDINSPRKAKKSQPEITTSTSPKSRVKSILTENTGNVKSPRRALNITKQKSLRKVEATKQLPVEEDVPEKTLYVIEPSVEERSNITSPSMKSEKESSTKGYNPVQIPESPVLPDQKEESKHRPIRVEKITSDDGDWSPRKLKFRRGKVVKVGFESSSPKKLKFRQGKVLDESQEIRGDETRVGKVKRFSSVGEYNGNKGESPKVKVELRHQDVEERKDTQCLFNNVIEETASKLVETRKSKVKALVGAFESLTSLKDIKPSEVK